MFSEQFDIAHAVVQVDSNPSAPSVGSVGSAATRRALRCKPSANSAALKKAGDTDERIFAVAAWRESSFFTDAERAALALAEAITRLSDRVDPVPDDVWDDAARHYDQPQLAALVLAIANVNFWNRLNAATRQIAAATW